MSAAQELAERGFSVTVVEARGVPGGKARSLRVPASGQSGRRDLPGEHGFRFFPGFYRHLPDAMRRIPTAIIHTGVLDNLQNAREPEIAQAGSLPAMKMGTHFPRSIGGLQL